MVSVGILFLLVFAVGCGNSNENVTQEDLQKNDWLVESEDDEDEVIMTVSFTENELTFGIDPSSLESEAASEMEELGEAFVEEFLAQFEYTMNYTLDENELMMQNPDNEHETTFFTLERDGKKIIFTPTEEMNDEDGGFVLKPR
ncbi:hypothetical protein [Enterococcus casseliflavus]|uniref:hypothetical protein n=1 Tax=Enterococcus casseliflavus TaxID=37734 RepID=UPI0021CA6285|nr:hypothetical protein [Enterococcus casseliflavus]